MKKLALLFFIAFNCNSQEKETVYILYEPEEEKTCNFSMYRDGRDKKIFSYVDQKILKENGTIIFIMCKIKFQSSVNLSPKTIDSLSDLNIVDINYMYSQTEIKWPETAGDTNFQKIYILEKISSEKYFQYEVKWLDNFK